VPDALRHQVPHRPAVDEIGAREQAELLAKAPRCEGDRPALRSRIYRSLAPLVGLVILGQQGAVGVEDDVRVQQQPAVAAGGAAGDRLPRAVLRVDEAGDQSQVVLLGHAAQVAKDKREVAAGVIAGNDRGLQHHLWDVRGVRPPLVSVAARVACDAVLGRHQQADVLGRRLLRIPLVNPQVERDRVVCVFAFSHRVLQNGNLLKACLVVQSTRANRTAHHEH